MTLNAGTEEGREIGIERLVAAVQAAADIDRAIARLEEGPTSETARTLRRMSVAMRTIVAAAEGDSGVAAINEIIEAMSVLRDIHRDIHREQPTRR